MIFANPLVRLLGYCFFISPPKALDIIRNQPKDGELKNLPVWVVVVLEGFIRIGLLLVISTSLQEYVLGKDVYEAMKLDDCFTLIVLVGLFHFTIYYLLAVCCAKVTLRRRMLGLYRLLRNLGYASLSGLPFYALGNLAISERWVEASLSEYILPITLGVCAIFAVAGLVEGLARRRAPLGLDQSSM